MKQLWKRNIVAATILLFVCAAVYLNWKYASGLPGETTTDVGQKILGESTLVSGGAQTGEEETGADDSTETGSVEETSADAGDDYFASARLSRQQARDSAIALLREAAESETADVAVANEAAETIQVLAGYALAEAQIENLVTAKGYSECVAFMGDGAISVVVEKEGGLQAEDVAKITEIVLSETDYTTDQITVLEAN